jgi:hypothetical protein
LTSIPRQLAAPLSWLLLLTLSGLLPEPGSAQPRLPESPRSRFFNERTEYALTFKGIGAAEASIQYSPGDPEKIVARIDTKALTSLIFAVHNRYEADLEPAAGLPATVRKDIAQKNIKQILEISYDRAARLGHGSNGAAWSIIPDAVDLFTMLFQLRMRSPLPGDSISFPLDIESQAWIATGVTLPGGEMTGPSGQTPTRKVILKFTRKAGTAARTWKTDLLTNRIARPDGMLTVFLGPPPEDIPLLLQFGQPGQQVIMRLVKYQKGS